MKWIVTWMKPTVCNRNCMNDIKFQNELERLYTLAELYKSQLDEAPSPVEAMSHYTDLKNTLSEAICLAQQADRVKDLERLQERSIEARQLLANHLWFTDVFAQSHFGTFPTFGIFQNRTNKKK